MRDFNNLIMDQEPALSDQALAKQFFHHLILCTPLLLTVPIIYLLALNSLGQGSISVWPVCLGALGWTAALFLRTPMMVLLLKLTRKINEQVVAAMAGPAEEAVRLLVVIFLQAKFTGAISVGLGWASIEVVYTIISGFSTVAILSQGGVGAIQLRKRFADAGQSVPVTVYSGVVERLSATALHTGFTLLLSYHPLLILLTVPLHSFTNVAAITLNNRSALATQLLIAILGMTTLLFGIKLFI
jgi:hypothetical protein